MTVQCSSGVVMESPMKWWWGEAHGFQFSISYSYVASRMRFSFEDCASVLTIVQYGHKEVNKNDKWKPNEPDNE